MTVFLNPDGLWRPFGAFSQVAVTQTGRLAIVKGQPPLGSDGQLVGAGDMRAQLLQVLDNLEAAVGAVGIGLSDIVELRVFTTDIDAFMAASDIRAERLAPPYPVTTTVEVSRLYRPDVLVEIAATAELAGKRKG